MKWVAKCTRIIVTRGDGRAAYTSPRGCPPKLLKHVKTVVQGSQARSVMVANREAVEVLRRHGSANPSAGAQKRPRQATRPRWKALLAKWQVLAATGLLVLAIVGILLSKASSN